MQGTVKRMARLLTCLGTDTKATSTFQHENHQSFKLNYNLIVNKKDAISATLMYEQRCSYNTHVVTYLNLKAPAVPLQVQ